MTEQIEGGFIILARQILSTELTDMPTLYMSIWIYLLAKANYKDTKFLNRGQLLTTYEDIQHFCGYNQGNRREKPKKETVKNALKWFKKRKMIHTRQVGQQMEITVVNYALYQNPENYKQSTSEVISPESGQPAGEPSGQPAGEPAGEPPLASEEYGGNQEWSPDEQMAGQPSGEPAGKPAGKPAYPSGEPSGKPAGQPPLASEEYGGNRESNPLENMSGQPSGQPAGQPAPQEERLEEGLQERQEVGTYPSGEGYASSAATSPPSDDPGQSKTALTPEVRTKPKIKQDCPHNEIIALYHELLPELPEIRSWSETSKKNLRARWRESKERQSLEWWRWFFENYIRTSDFLMGKIKPFQANLTWIVGPKNFEKILNGQYVNRNPSTGSKQTDSNLEAVQAFINGY